MPVCDVLPYVHNSRVHRNFYGFDLKKGEIVVLENKPWRSLDKLIMETTADSKSKETLVTPRPTCSIAAREGFLELFCD